MAQITICRMAFTQLLKQYLCSKYAINDGIIFLIMILYYSTKLYVFKQQ